jgi:hypothetical protein
MQDSGDKGALVPSWGNDCRLSRARAPVRRDATVIAAIGEPKLGLKL